MASDAVTSKVSSEPTIAASVPASSGWVLSVWVSRLQCGTRDTRPSAFKASSHAIWRSLTVRSVSGDGIRRARTGWVWKSCRLPVRSLPVAEDSPSADNLIVDRPAVIRMDPVSGAPEA